MLNVALSGLLAVSLLTGAPGGDDDKDKKSKKADAQQSVVIVGDEVSEPSVQNTYSLGRMSSASPIKLWAEFAYGTADQIRDTAGENGGEISIGEGRILRDADIQTTRVVVGAEVTPITFNNLQVGVGARLTAAKNEVEGTFDNPGLVALNSARNLGLPDELINPASGDPARLSSGQVGVQNIEFFGAIRGRALGVHGGYILDLGDAQEFTDEVPELGGARIPLDLPRSDNRDALNFGVDFDYPTSDLLRLFGGIDYYHLFEPGCDNADLEGMYDEYFDACPNVTDNDEGVFGAPGDGIWNFAFGAGLRLSVVEIGAAAQIATRDRQPLERNSSGTVGTEENIGGYAATISPYLRFSPPQFPASIYVRGEVMDEYNGYGYFLDGANTARPEIGFTAGISIGFE